MSASRPHALRLIALLLSLLVLAAACGSTAAEEQDADDTAQDDEGSEPDRDDDEDRDDADARDDEDADEEPSDDPAPTPTAPEPPATPSGSAGGAAGTVEEGTRTSFTDTVPMASTGGAPYTYTTVTDDTGRISVEIPAEWTDVDGAPVDVGGVTISDIRASTDLAAFASGWDVPGVAVSAGDVDRTPAQVLDDERVNFEAACTYLGRQPYADVLYLGEFDTYAGCGGTETAYVVVAARDDTGTGPLIEVQVQVLGERDVEALDHILRSFVAF